MTADLGAKPAKDVFRLAALRFGRQVWWSCGHAARPEHRQLLLSLSCQKIWPCHSGGGTQVCGWLTPEEFEVFKRHLAQFQEQEVCPICQSSSWQVVGMEAGVPLVNDQFSLGGPTMAVVAVCCDKCFFVRHFAWYPMAAQARKSHG